MKPHYRLHFSGSLWWVTNGAGTRTMKCRFSRSAIGYALKGDFFFKENL